MGKGGGDGGGKWTKVGVETVIVSSSIRTRARVNEILSYGEMS